MADRVCHNDVLGTRTFYDLVCIKLSELEYVYTDVITTYSGRNHLT